jgi:hypothetical protein
MTQFEFLDVSLCDDLMHILCCWLFTFSNRMHSEIVLHEELWLRTAPLRPRAGELKLLELSNGIIVRGFNRKTRAPSRVFRSVLDIRPSTFAQQLRTRKQTNVSSTQRIAFGLGIARHSTDTATCGVVQSLWWIVRVTSASLRSAGQPPVAGRPSTDMVERRERACKPRYSAQRKRWIVKPTRD